jgi:uncharacterized Zn finger protein (UPF0148 family)
MGEELGKLSVGKAKKNGTEKKEAV